MSLTDYNKKRNFKNTTEPKGKKFQTFEQRFVIQYHQARTKHFDFRLEHRGVLLSWAIPKGLSSDPKVKRLAVHVEDHPVDYINFEGIIPKGNYGAGTVEIFDFGFYSPIEDMDKGLKKGHIKVLLCGDKIKGAWSLIKTQGENWMAIKIDDEFANLKQSKKSTKNPFSPIDVQLATLSTKIPSGKDWIFEIKYDGYRITSYIENKKVKMLTRNGLDYTSKFKNISKALQGLSANSFVVDGEIVSFDSNGKSDFGLFQQNLKSGKSDFYYVIFDLLAIDGEDIRRLPLITRKSKLERLLFDCPNCLMFSSHVENGKECFEFAKQHGLEGMVAKNINSKYTSSRSEDWLKIKCYLRQEFVIVGYTTTNQNPNLSAVLVGYYKDKKLIFAGKVGTGFDSNQRKELRKLFTTIEQKTCSCENVKSLKNVTWLKPKFVAEIQYAEFTKEGILRQASFLGLRHDKNPKDVVLEGKS